MARGLAHLGIQLFRRPTGSPIANVGRLASLFELRYLRERVAFICGRRGGVTIFVIAHGAVGRLAVHASLRANVFLTGFPLPPVCC